MHRQTPGEPSIESLCPGPRSRDGAGQRGECPALAGQDQADEDSGGDGGEDHRGDEPGAAHYVHDAGCGETEYQHDDPDDRIDAGDPGEDAHYRSLARVAWCRDCCAGGGREHAGGDGHRADGEDGAEDVNGEQEPGHVFSSWVRVSGKGG
jgi:hypothetical protein